MSQKRKGFFLIWEIVMLSILFMLSGTAAVMVHTMVKEEGEQEMGQDTRLLMQDILEREKYNCLSSSALPLPDHDGKRNGRTYQWDLEDQRKSIHGVDLRAVTCRVQIGSAVSEAILLLPLDRPHEAEGISSL